jgi:hypothetical protein
MSDIDTLLEIGVLLLLPLLPAGIIFYLLTTRQQRLKDRGDETTGDFVIPGINLKMSFRSFGSSATYLVLLAFSSAMYIHMEKEKAEHAVLIARNSCIDERKRLEAHFGWLVTASVVVVDPDGKERAPFDPIYKQITASFEPPQSIENNTITFRAAKNDGRFPQVNLSIAGSPRASINLNDRTVARFDAPQGTIEVIPPVAIKLMEAH